MSRSEPVLERWPVEKLRKHSLQDPYFGKRSDEDLQELAEAIRRNGMTAIDVLPDGTVLSGHQRWYIARYILKWTDVPVNVRYDLLAKGQEACDQYFLHANMLNREPSMLQKVRAFALDCELEERRRKKDKSLGKRERLGRVRDAVAKRFGKSGRTLADWQPILSAPAAIQAAVEDKRLSREQAMRILAAPDDVQAKIASDLVKRKTPAKVLKQHLGRVKREPLTLAKLTRRWRDLARVVGDLFHHLPNSFAALLPEQRSGVEFVLEFAELIRQHLNAASEGPPTEAPAVKLRRKTAAGDKHSEPPPKIPLKLKRNPLIADA